jgi:hypothetical protein
MIGTQKEKLLMLRKTALTAALTLMLVAAGTSGRASAQESSAARTAPEAEKVVSAYRLDFSVNEMEDGKKINTRQYSMNSRPGDGNEIKIGTRVPVEVKQGEFQYLDVGTNIWCRLRDQSDITSLGSNVLLNVRAELSNFALPDQQAAQQFHPVVRQLKIDASTIAVPGKTMLVGTVDDPNSKRQFQLEVTVSKLR